MNKLISIVMLATAIFLSGCTADNEPGIENGKFPKGPNLSDFRDSEWKIYDFSSKFMSAASNYWQTECVDENTMLSPLGASITLAMLANGASQESKTEILNAFEIDDSGLERLNKAMQNICRDLPHNVKGSVITMANGLWLYDILSIDSDYSKKLNDIFNTSIDTFDNQTSGITKINSWVNKNTNGLINKLLSDDNNELLMLIANVLYMNASWKDDFKESSMRNFTNADNSVSLVEMMSGNQEIDTFFETSDGSRMFTIGYADNNISLTIYIPSEKNSDDISDFEKLNSITYFSQDMTPGSGTTMLTMPKFSFNTDNNLKPILRLMGVNALFESESLTSINYSSGEAASIDFFRQKMRLDVDEKGCAVAVVTYAGFDGASLPPAPVPNQITIDRPFLFKIEAYGLPLLEGRVVKL